MNGGVGDHVAALTAVKYIDDTYPWINILLWVPDFLVELSKHLLPTNIRIGSYTDMETKYNRNKPTKTTAWDGSISPMKIHCLEYAFLKLCDEQPSDKYIYNYLQIDPTKINIDKHYLPDNYVVVTTGFTAAVREFPANEVNKITDYIKAKGLEVVFLGQTSTKTGSAHVIKGTFSEDLDLSKGINLIDRTSLLEATKIMGGAKAVIGVDNGLLHLAGCTQVPIVGGFTTVSPELRMPVRNNELGWNYYAVKPDLDLKCRYCQVKTNFLYGHDYTTCMYKDNLCTKQMTAEKFITALERII